MPTTRCQAIPFDPKQFQARNFVRGRRAASQRSLAERSSPPRNRASRQQSFFCAASRARVEVCETHRAFCIASRFWRRVVGLSEPSHAKECFFTPLLARVGDVRETFPPRPLRYQSGGV